MEEEGGDRGSDFQCPLCRKRYYFDSLAKNCCSQAAQHTSDEQGSSSKQAAQPVNVQGQQGLPGAAGPSAPSRQPDMIHDLSYLQRRAAQQERGAGRVSARTQFFSPAIHGKGDAELRQMLQEVQQSNAALTASKKNKAKTKTPANATNKKPHAKNPQDAENPPQRQTVQEAEEVNISEEQMLQLQENEKVRDEMAEALPSSEFDEWDIVHRGFDSAITYEQLRCLEYHQLLAWFRVKQINTRWKTSKTRANLIEIAWFYVGQQQQPPVMQGLPPVAEFNAIPAAIPVQLPAPPQLGTDEQAMKTGVTAAILAARVLEENQALVGDVPHTASNRRLQKRDDKLKITVEALQAASKAVENALQVARKKNRANAQQLAKRSLQREAKQRKMTKKQVMKERKHAKRMKGLQTAARHLQDTAPPRPIPYAYTEETCTPCPVQPTMVLTAQGVRVKAFNNSGEAVWTNDNSQRRSIHVTHTNNDGARPSRKRKHTDDNSKAIILPCVLQDSTNVEEHVDVRGKAANLCLWLLEGDERIQQDCAPVVAVFVLIIAHYHVHKDHFNPPDNLTIVAGKNAGQPLNADNLPCDEEGGLDFWKVYVQGNTSLATIKDWMREMTERSGFDTSIVEHSTARDDMGDKEEEEMKDDSDDRAEILMICGPLDLLGVSGQVRCTDKLQITEQWDDDNSSDSAGEDSSDDEYKANSGAQQAEGSPVQSEDEDHLEYDSDSVDSELSDTDESLTRIIAERERQLARLKEREANSKKLQAERAKKLKQDKVRALVEAQKHYQQQQKQRSLAAASSLAIIAEGGGDDEGDAAAGASSNSAAGAL